MIIFLLLVIIAIMLLGASRFFGIVAAFLGVLVAIIAVGVGLGSIASAFDMEAGDLLMYVLFASLPLLIVWAIASSVPKAKPSRPTEEIAVPQKFVASDPLPQEERKAIRRKLRGLE